MPKLKIARIVSVSSEDPNYPASNILLDDPNKKWKCKNPGEKSAIIVLQLEEASQITSIDIGNENSAYVEVLVSRSGTNEEFKPLLVMSSFMTPLEARQSQNINKVRMFTTEQLSKPECEEKWDKIKIVCTQPFNRHVQYGLSFINFYTAENKTNTNTNPLSLGRFKLRPESPDRLEIGSLFARRKELQQDEPLKGAAAIRESTSSPNNQLRQCKAQLCSGLTPNNNKKNTTNGSAEVKPQSRNRNEVLYDEDDQAPHERIDKIVEKNRQAKQAERENETPNKAKEKKVEKTDSTKAATKEKTSTFKNNEKDTPSTSTDSKKRKSSNGDTPVKKKVKTVVRKPFAELLEGVVLVISGIQNPNRAIIRSKALSMGAKYKPDWDNTCTHLICAFANTPKFKQVKGKGKIVRKEWIEDCYNQRKRLPWRRYALDFDDLGEEESEEEIWEQGENNEENSEEENTDTEVFGYDDSKVEERIIELTKKNETQQDSEETKKTKKTELSEEKDVYSQDTDEEPLTNMPKPRELPKFLSLFRDKTFYIDKNFEEDAKKQLIKYITIYDGKILDDPTAKLDYIVTNKDNVSLLKDTNSEALFLTPDWVWSCHNRQELVDIEDFRL